MNTLKSYFIHIKNTKIYEQSNLPSRITYNHCPDQSTNKEPNCWCFNYLKKKRGLVTFTSELAFDLGEVTLFSCFTTFSSKQKSSDLPWDATIRNMSIKNPPR